MRNILFKAKTTYNDKWVEGGYCESAETTYCFEEDYKKNTVTIHRYIVVDQMTDWGLPNNLMFHKVKPDTVCQYTGQKDKNGKKIFEGDILKHEDECVIEVIWNAEKYGFAAQCVKGSALLKECKWGLWEFESDEVEVIGNVFDNPELLKGE